MNTKKMTLKDIEFYDVIEKNVKAAGNTAHVYVPKDWIGGRVKVFLIEEP